MKIAVSLPAETLRGIETARKRLGRSRSSIVAEALDAWLAARAVYDRDRQYLEGYRRWPEPEEDTVAAAVMRAWDGWDAPRSPAPKRERSRNRRGHQ